LISESNNKFLIESNELM